MDVRWLQRPLKEQYRRDPNTSRITLTAKGNETSRMVFLSRVQRELGVQSSPPVFVLAAWRGFYVLESTEGVVEFRYALRANKRYDPAAASQFAIGLSQPLMASVASSNEPLPSLLQIEPSDVLALTLKPSDAGDAWIIRLFGASGEDRKARLHWSAPTPPRLWLSDLSERPIRALVAEITVAGWDLVSLRADRMG